MLKDETVLAKPPHIIFIVADDLGKLTFCKVFVHLHIYQLIKRSFKLSIIPLDLTYVLDTCFSTTVIVAIRTRHMHVYVGIIYTCFL